jgi:hypothetical protein
MCVCVCVYGPWKGYKETEGDPERSLGNHGVVFVCVYVCVCVCVCAYVWPMERL